MIEFKVGEQSYEQVPVFPYLGCKIMDTSKMEAEVANRRGRAMHKMQKYSKQLFDNQYIELTTKVSIFKSEVMEALLYGCANWSLKKEHFDLFRQLHHKLLMRLIGFKKFHRTDRTLSYHCALEITDCESVETTIRRRRLLWAGAIARMPDDRLPKQILFGELNGGERLRGGQETKWRRCVMDDLRSFNIPLENWVELAQEGDAWATKVQIGADNFMNEWHEQERRASAERQLKRQRENASNNPTRAPRCP
jgi:hypothetical protein